MDTAGERLPLLVQVVLDTTDARGWPKRDWSAAHPTKKSAQEALTEELQRRNDGVVLRRERLTLDGYLEQWLEHLHQHARTEDNPQAKRPRSTIDRYDELLRHHVRPYLGSRPLSCWLPPRSHGGAQHRSETFARAAPSVCGSIDSTSPPTTGTARERRTAGPRR